MLNSFNFFAYQITFPPNIYYKIFTHRPIVDLCACSPKDYTHEAQRQPVPRQTHNHHPVANDDRSSWYKRVENNGWRVLAGKVGLCLFTVTVGLCVPDCSVQLHFFLCRLLSSAIQSHKIPVQRSLSSGTPNYCDGKMLKRRRR